MWWCWAGPGGARASAAPAVLEALRRDGVGTIDLLVVADPSVPPALVDLVARAHPIAGVLAQGGALLDTPPEAVQRPTGGSTTLELGGLTVRVVVVPDRLVVDAVPRSP